MLINEQIDDVAIEQTVSKPFNMTAFQTHMQMEVYYLIRGSRIYCVETRMYQLAPGSLIFVGANRTHKTFSVSSEPHERLLFMVDSRFLRRWRARFPDLPLDALPRCPEIVCALRQESPYMESQILRIMELCREKPLGYREEVSSLLLGVLLFLIRQPSARAQNSLIESPKYQKVYEIAEYISQNCASVTSLDALSKQFYINKFYMCHSFQEVIGSTINTFLNITRIQRARTLLVEGDKSMTAIARELGYDSAASFSRVFKKTVGVTPREFRKRATDLWSPLQ